MTEVRQVCDHVMCYCSGCVSYQSAKARCHLFDVLPILCRGMHFIRRDQLCRCRIVQAASRQSPDCVCSMHRAVGNVMRHVARIVQSRLVTLWKRSPDHNEYILQRHNEDAITSVNVFANTSTCFHNISSSSNVACIEPACFEAMPKPTHFLSGISPSRRFP
jgi:phage-related baseplate assembly protein